MLWNNKVAMGYDFVSCSGGDTWREYKSFDIVLWESEVHECVTFVTGAKSQRMVTKASRWKVFQDSVWLSALQTNHICEGSHNDDDAVRWCKDRIGMSVEVYNCGLCVKPGVTVLGAALDRDNFGLMEVKSPSAAKVQVKLDRAIIIRCKDICGVTVANNGADCTLHKIPYITEMMPCIPQFYRDYNQCCALRVKYFCKPSCIPSHICVCINLFIRATCLLRAVQKHEEMHCILNAFGSFHSNWSRLCARLSSIYVKKKHCLFHYYDKHYRSLFLVKKLSRVVAVILILQTIANLV